MSERRLASIKKSDSPFGESLGFSPLLSRNLVALAEETTLFEGYEDGYVS